jgi:hypothetical protein
MMRSPSPTVYDRSGGGLASATGGTFAAAEPSYRTIPRLPPVPENVVLVTPAAITFPSACTARALARSFSVDPRCVSTMAVRLVVPSSPQE